MHIERCRCEQVETSPGSVIQEAFIFCKCSNTINQLSPNITLLRCRLECFINLFQMCSNHWAGNQTFAFPDFRASQKTMRETRMHIHRHIFSEPGILKGILSQRHASFLRDRHPFSKTGILSQRQASRNLSCRPNKPSRSNSLSRAKDEAVPKGAQRASQLRLCLSAGGIYIKCGVM